MVTVTAFLAFFSIVLGSASAQSNCTRPQNAIRVNLSQLIGAWYVHELVNIGQLKIDVSCVRMEFFEGLNELVITETYYTASTGELGLPRVAEVTAGDDGNFQTVNFKEKNIVYYYSLKLTDDFYIASLCDTQDKRSSFQATVVFGRNQIEEPDRIASELKSVGVDVQNYYSVPQDSCVLTPPPLFILLRPFYRIWRAIW